MTDLATLLAQSGLLSPSQLDQARAERARSGRRLARILIEDAILDERLLFDTLAELAGYPRFDLRVDPVERSAGTRCDPTWVRTHGIVPIWADRERGRLHVATPDPTRKPLFAQIRGRTGFTARPLVASESETEALYRHIYRQEPLIRDPTRINRSGPRPNPPIEIAAVLATGDLVEAGPPGDPAPPGEPNPRPDPDLGLAGWSAVAPPIPPGSTTDLGRLRPILERQQASADQLRRLVEACEALGLFTRDEYLARLDGADRDDGDRAL